MEFSTLKIKFNYDGEDYVTTIRKEDVCGNDCDWWDWWFDSQDGKYTFQVAGDMRDEEIPTDQNLRVFVYNFSDYEDEDRIAEIEDIEIIKPEWKKFKEVVAGDSIFVTNGLNTFKLNVESVDKYGSIILQKDDELRDCQYVFDVPKYIEDSEDKHDSSVAFHYTNGTLEYVIIADKDRCLEYLENWRNRINENIEKISKCGYKWVLTTEHIFEGLQVHSVNEYADKDCCYNNMREVALSVLQHFENKELIKNKFVKIEFKENAIWIDLGDDIRFTYNIVKC